MLGSKLRLDVGGSLNGPLASGFFPTYSSEPPFPTGKNWKNTRAKNDHQDFFNRNVYL